MNIIQLEYFLAASRTLNFTRAAQETFTSRQNLSHAIHELERELGCALFAQEGARLVLTVEGTEVARHAKRIIKEIAAMRDACAPKCENEPLNVAVGTNLISCTNYDISASLETYEGDIRLSEHACEMCYSTVVEGTTDVAIIGCMERGFPGCEKKLLHRSPLYLLVSAQSALAGKQSIDIVDLAGHRLCMLPSFKFQFEPFVAAYEARGFDMGNIDVISSVGLMLRTVRRDDAVGIASASFWDDPPEGTLVKPVAGLDMQMDLYVLYRIASEKAPSIAAFISCLEQTLAI